MIECLGYISWHKQRRFLRTLVNVLLLLEKITKPSLMNLEFGQVLWEPGDNSKDN